MAGNEGRHVERRGRATREPGCTRQEQNSRPRGASVLAAATTLLFLMLGPGACSKKDPSALTGEGATSAAPSTDAPSSAPATDAASAAPTEQKGGKMVFKYVAPKNAEYEKIREYVVPQEILQVIEVVNKVIVLPRDVGVRTEECNEANAYYSPDRHAIIICFELPDHIYRALGQLGYEHAVVAETTRQAMIFTFLHELGHAIIGELDIGVPGGEEDVADDFATLFLVDMKSPGIIEAGAVAMMQLGKMADKPKMWDQHSFGEQRFFNILCSLVGSDPEKFGKVYVPNPLPEERAQNCPEEYKKKDKYWSQMLEPHFRK